MTYWKDIYARLSRSNLRVTAVTSETDTQAIKDYLYRYGVEDWDVAMIDEEQARKFKLFATPTTIIVDKHGIVEKVWTGLWNTNDANSAKEYLTTITQNNLSE